MPLRLKGKIILVTVAILAFIIGTNTLISIWFFTQNYSEALYSKMLVIAQNLKSQLDRLLEFEIPLNELIGFEEQCQVVVQSYPEISYAMIVDSWDKILFHNDPSQHGRILSNSGVVKHTQVKKGTTQIVLLHRGEYYEIVLPVFNRNGKIIASVRLGFREATITRKVHNLIVFSVGVAVFLFGLGILLLIFILSAWVTNPLQKLTTLVKQVGENGMRNAKKVEIDSKDELGELAGAFNQMTMDLKQTTVSVDFLNNIVGSVLDAIIVTDPSIKIKSVNRAACKILKFKEEELIGKKVDIIFTESEKTRFMEKVLHIIDGVEFMTYETYLQTREYQQIPALISGSVIKDQEGNIINFVFTGKDTTEIKKIEKEATALQDQLRQAQRLEAIGTLAGGIAHDFNNILAAICGYTELSLSKVSSDSPLSSYLHNVLQAGRRASELIDQILTFSRKREEVKKPVQISLVVKEVLKLLRASLPTTIEIRHRIEPEQGYVFADSTGIHQVLMNLCTNAAHAMQEKGGILEITLEEIDLDNKHTTQLQLKPGSYQKMTVTDTGHGMEPYILERVFEPYFTTKEKCQGTGLGLSVAHGIVTSHGGAITASSNPGKGSTFTVYLPVIKDEIVAMTKDMEEKVIPRGHESILFVDDEQALVTLHKLMLEDLGYRVTTKISSIEALELFRNNPERFDLVITDMTMPNMTGDKLALELLRIREDIPIILCTGFSENVTEKSVLAMGIRAFIMKPILKHQIAKTIRRVLDGE